MAYALLHSELIFCKNGFRTEIDLAEIQSSEKIKVNYLNWLNQLNSTQVHFIF